MDVVVFGAGSLGSLVGGMLARAHDVTLVGRAPHVSTVADEGLRIEGAIEAVVHPEATTTVPDEAPDLALVTVKAFDTAAARDALAERPPRVTLSLQNGLGNEATLATALPTVLAGTCTYGARLVEPGTVACTGLGEVTLGPPAGGRSADADRVGRAFEVAGLATHVSEAMPRRLWEKLAINAGINAVTAVARVENGSLEDDPARAVACRAARETARLARHEGVDLPDERAVTALDRVVTATAANRSSMLQDVMAGRRTEVDAINGVVADGPLDAPVNETLAGVLRAWESGHGVR